MDTKDRLRACAIKVREILDSRDVQDPLIRKSKVLIGPFIQGALGDQAGLPDRLPSFFFGMREDELAATYLRDSELLNALAEFDMALAARSHS